MRPAGRKVKIAVLGGLLVFILSLFLFFSPKLGLVTHHYATLPYIGPTEVVAPGDTDHFTVPSFSFTDQYGKEVSDARLAGKIIVADFFFTSCTSICPRMSAEMQQLQLRLADDPAYDDVVFLSHTVDPEHDTPEVLRAYARKLQADSARWIFATGKPEVIYRQGNLGYLLSAGADSTAAEDFVHAPQFVLVDKRWHIRGMYDGTNTTEVNTLFTDLKNLVREENERTRLEKKGRP